MEKRSYIIEKEDPDFVDEERQGYGAYISAEVYYKLTTVVEYDTPHGQDLRLKIDIEDIEAQIFVSDQDGGELYDRECDALDYWTESEIIEEIEKGLNDG